MDVEQRVDYVVAESERVVARDQTAGQARRHFTKSQSAAMKEEFRV
jgi:hypothetical protein